MYDEEVRPYNILGLLIEADGLLYEKTLGEGTVQPSYSYIRFCFHLSLHCHLCSGIRFVKWQLAWVDYLDTMHCAAIAYIAILQQCTCILTMMSYRH